MTYPQPNTQKPAPTFGSIQREFAYTLYNFRVNDQFTIVEDLPSTKPIRQITKIANKTGKPYQVFVIRITSNNFEANLELYESELNKIAIACPKDITNFKGVTLAFDGQKWVYVCQDTNTPGTGQSAPISQPQQPQNQKSLFLTKMIGSMRALESVGVPVDAAKLTKMCDAMSPGNALELIAAAKSQGLIVESQGIFRVIE